MRGGKFTVGHTCSITVGVAEGGGEWWQGVVAGMVGVALPILMLLMLLLLVVVYSRHL
jgi:hypothetical protein